MIKGLYRSAAGMLPLPYKQDLVTNNLANNDTAGFKQDRSFIRDLVEADLYLNANGIAATNQPPGDDQERSAGVPRRSGQFQQCDRTGHRFQSGPDGNDRQRFQPGAGG